MKSPEIFASHMTSTLTLEGYVESAKEIAFENPETVIWLVWITMEDLMVCDMCAPLHGRRQHAEAPHFQPPKHPRCRCFLGIMVGGKRRRR